MATTTLSMESRKKSAEDFIERWSDRGHEKQDTQSFWLDLLHNVYGIENPSGYVDFELPVRNMETQNYIDGYIEETRVLIEQKSSHIDLNKGELQSDGSLLSPFQQAQRYDLHQPFDKKARWIIVSNFKEFRIHDMNDPYGAPAVVILEDLVNEYYRLDFMIDRTNEDIEKETAVSIEAGDLIGEVYRELLNQYIDPESPHTLESINILCVRFVFCFYAEDAGLFGTRGAFHNYLADYDTNRFREAIIKLFKVLNTPEDERDPYIDDKLAAFPYVNGGLFAEEDIEIPRFTDHLRELILENAASDFDWSEISPTIFGGVFESTLNPDQRRKGGMHYTSIENIHKVIDPLFLDDLKEELAAIQQLKQPARRKSRARAFQDKLASLQFLDPACGSGNFLTETYLSLRELENQAFTIIYGDDTRLMVIDDFIKVSLDQFHGIEINDFAVSVASTAMWIAESQMFEKTKDLIFIEKDYLPLSSSVNVVEGNALTMNWDTVVDRRDLDYIMGNPPFLGYHLQKKEQKDDLKSIYTDSQGKLYPLAGKIDYVAGWFFKAANYIKGTSINIAFVATNSITQGEQVRGVWQPIYEEFDISINFAYRTFKWNSETQNKASVHVIIIGFSYSAFERMPKYLYDEENAFKKVSIINPYLVEAPVTFVNSTRKPLSDVSIMKKGSQATDGGNLFLTSEEKDDFIISNIKTKKYIKKVCGSTEFLHKKTEYCLWLKEATPNELKSMPKVMERIEKVRDNRLKSKKKKTREQSKIPHLFTEDRQPKSDYLLIPKVSSGRRKYIPVGHMSADIIAKDSVFTIPNATLYEFGIITSNMHMAWVRTVAGRLKSDYNYSATIVYNNFPWPNATEDQRQRIEETAQNVLDARALYPDASMDDLYDELTMPPELRKAHQHNDRAVMQAYDMKVGPTSEADAVALLFEMYQDLVSED